MNKYYTGIGSRNIYPEEAEFLENVAVALYKEGFTLRSGGAVGADSAFEKAVVACACFRSLPSPLQIFLPWRNFNGHTGYPLYEYLCTPSNWPLWSDANTIMRDIHPTPERLKSGPEALHTRNIPQILGPKLDNPSKFVIYCADEMDGEVKGGTRTAVVLARQYKIPTFNIRIPEHKERLEKWLQTS